MKQCPTCPWRVGVDPERDIPNGYSVELHESLRGTISEGLVSLRASRAMACHYSKPGKEFACAGWLHNQIGPGNNIGVRIAVAAGRLPVPEVDGPQHEHFDDTLPAREQGERAGS